MINSPVPPSPYSPANPPDHIPPCQGLSGVTCGSPPRSSFNVRYFFTRFSYLPIQLRHRRDGYRFNLLAVVGSVLPQPWLFVVVLFISHVDKSFLIHITVV